MSKTRFNSILSQLKLYTTPFPKFKDVFHQIRELVEAWNANMLLVFIVGWLCCLDESMSKWLSMFACPGFVFCPQKPCPYGNKWHTIVCVLTSIIFFIELVEGKDRAKELGEQKYNKLSDNAPLQKTVGLLLRMTEQLWYSTRVVVLDSRFYVLQGIIELAKCSIYATAIINQQTARKNLFPLYGSVPQPLPRTTCHWWQQQH